MESSWMRIGHRGAAGSAPEHTRASFEHAVRAGVDMIELDVQLSQDHALVVMHDLTLDRTTDSHGSVRDRTWDELQQLDCGSWFDISHAGERVLSLDDVIELLPPHVRLNVEIKALEEDWDPLAERLMRLLRKTQRVESTIISSFLFGALERVRAAADDARIGLLIHDPDLTGVWEWAERLGAVSLHPFFAFVDESKVRAAQQQGLQVITWTVNDMEIARRLIDMGVDGIISDFPDRLMTIDSKG